MSSDKTMRSVLLGLWSLVFAVGMGSSPNWLQAQTSFGTILGTVTDPSEAAIPDVAITVSNAQTGISRQANTDQYGNYRVESLLPGIYIVKADKQGFQHTEVSGVELPVARTVTINVVMQLGAVTQTVEVTAAAPLLDTATATVGTVVSNTSVVTLPLNGRNFTDLILLVPGSVPAGSIFVVAGGRNFSVSGNRAEQNNFTLDGVYNNEEFFKQFSLQPSIDAIQEFKIQTNITSAEYGQAAGANINVAIKSGTNEIHGSVFEFLRNDKLDANDWFRNYFSTPTSPSVKRPLRRNQYGAVVGGPVYLGKLYDGRNRTFWLFNYEGIKVRRGSTVVATIPTAAQFTGDLRDLPPVFDPETRRQVGVDANGDPIFARDQISCNGVLNVICPARIDPFIKDYAAIFYPSLNPNPGENVVRVVNPSPFSQDQFQWTIRADHKIRENLTFYSRFSLADADQTNPQALPVLTNSLSNKFRNFVASWTYVANPTTVIDWKLGYNRSNLQIADSNPDPGWEAFLASHPIQGTPVKSARLPLYPPLELAGYTSPGQSGFPFPSNVYQVLGSLSKIKGRHSIRTGMDFTNMRNLDDGLFTTIFQFSSLPTADPQNLGATGSSLASYLLGLPSAGLRNLGDTAAYMRQVRWQFYVQDDIKVTRKLMLNIGLRYEYNQWPVHRYDKLAGFDPTSGAYLWAGVNPLTGEPPNTRRSVRDPDFNNFAPRVGLAYLLIPKTTVRFAYGIFYVANQLWEAQGTRGNWPYAISETISGRNTPATLPADLRYITEFMPAYITPVPGVPPQSQHVLGRLDRTGYAQQWSTSVQRELARDLLLEVNYVGSRGVKQAIFTNINTPPPGPGVVGSPEHPRPFNQYGAMSLMSNTSSSIYHSLQIKAEKRFSNGLQFLSSYAWGKHIDIGGSCFACSSAPQNPNDPGADRALGSFDFRHVWTYSWFYQLPFGRGKKFLSGASGALNQILGGWEITGITRYNTGGPINVFMSEDIANIGPRSLSQRPDRVGPSSRNINPSDKTRGWLNPSAYRTPDPFNFGNLGRNTEKGPGFGNWDFGVLKNFPIQGEKRMIQFRTEFFNAFNHPNLGNYNSRFCEPIATCNRNFGRIFGTQNASREIQFALKILF